MTLGCLYDKEKDSSQKKKTKVLITDSVVTKATVCLYDCPPKAPGRPGEFWLIQSAVKRAKQKKKKNKESDEVWSEGKRGSRWAVWDTIKPETLGTDVCVT